MANLLGQNIGTNYKGILNLGSTINTPVSGTAQYITDGEGTASALSLSTTNVGIGTNAPSVKLHVKGTAETGSVLRLEPTTSTTVFSQVVGVNGDIQIQADPLNNEGSSAVKLFVDGSEIIRVTTDGLAFGPFAAANVLDDYEEGTWTPSQGSGLVVVGAFSSSGSYTKIGRMVVLRGVLTGATSVAANANQEIATNLPFTAATIFTGTIMNDASSLSGGIYVNSGAVIITTTIAATPSLYFSATYFV
jgi:hypothetical protein